MELDLKKWFNSLARQVEQWISFGVRKITKILLNKKLGGGITDKGFVDNRYIKVDKSHIDKKPVDKRFVNKRYIDESPMEKNVH